MREATPTAMISLLLSSQNCISFYICRLFTAEIVRELERRVLQHSTYCNDLFSSLQKGLIFFLSSFYPSLPSFSFFLVSFYFSP